MQAIELLLMKADALETRIYSESENDLLEASGILRHMLLEGLIEQAGNQIREHPVFEISEPKIPPITDGLTGAFTNDSLDPEAYPGCPTQRIALKDFLKTPIMCCKSQWLTVRDFVKVVANSLGGVHLGKPTAAREKIASEIGYLCKSSGDKIDLAVDEIRQIGKITLRALESLLTKIRQEHASPKIKDWLKKRQHHLLEEVKGYLRDLGAATKQLISPEQFASCASALDMLLRHQLLLKAAQASESSHAGTIRYTDIARLANDHGERIELAAACGGTLHEFGVGIPIACIPETLYSEIDVMSYCEHQWPLAGC